MLFSRKPPGPGVYSRSSIGMSALGPGRDIICHDADVASLRPCHHCEKLHEQSRTRELDGRSYPVIVVDRCQP